MQHNVVRLRQSIGNAFMVDKKKAKNITYDLQYLRYLLHNFLFDLLL